MSKTIETKFDRFDSKGVYVCVVCGKRTRNTGEGADVEMCKKCYQEAEQANHEADVRVLP